jgi:hypothetical protein
MEGVRMEVLSKIFYYSKTKSPLLWRRLLMLERLWKSGCKPLAYILGMSRVKTFLVRGT